MKPIFKKHRMSPGCMLCLLCLLTAAQTLFIWGNSLAGVEESTAISGGFTLILKNLLDPGQKIDPEFFHHIVRKAAHFTEFFVLGAMYSLTRHHLSAPRRSQALFLPPFATLFTAVCDEFIQSFTGRGTAVRDVMLDFCGAVCAIALIELICFLWQRTGKNKNNNQAEDSFE